MRSTRSTTGHAARTAPRGALVAVIGAGVIALAACGKDRDADDTTPIASADSVVAAAPAPVAEPITDIVAIVTVPDRVPLVGRRVTLTGLKVLTVTGPNTFWAGPSPDQQIFVVRADSGARDTTAGAAGPRVTVRAGQTASVSGVIRQIPADLGTVRSAWSLSTANEATLTRERVYLDADRVDVSGQ